MPMELAQAHIAQQVEHFLGKEEVIGSNPIVSTSIWERSSAFGAIVQTSESGRLRKHHVQGEV
jgi:hypothetical protein